MMRNAYKPGTPAREEVPSLALRACQPEPSARILLTDSWLAPCFCSSRFVMPLDDDYTWPPSQPPAHSHPPRERSPRPPFPWLTSLLTFLVVGGLCLLGAFLWGEYRAHQEAQNHNIFGVPREITPRGELSEIEKANISIYKQTKPSVLHITSLTVKRDEWTLNAQEVPKGTGSGFVWDDGGHVVTNYHVIEDAKGALVTLADHTTWRASLVGAAPDKDLAVLHIDAPKSKLVPILIGK